jgi:hypothetical protein
MIKSVITDIGSGDKAQVKDNALVVTQFTCLPMIPQKNKIFRQYMTDDGESDGEYDMRVAAGESLTDGACADHTGPTYTFTSVTGGLECAQGIQITDTGDGAHALLAYYKVDSVTDTNTVELIVDPTDGTNEVGINFTIQPIEFQISAHADNDRYITQLSFLIEDASSTLKTFGGETALTTGCEFFYFNLNERVVIHEALKSNWDFLRLCIAWTPAFGDAATAYELTNVIGTSDALAPVFDFTKIMPPYGLKLDAGSSQRLCLTVNDDTTAIDNFNIIAYGFERFE